MGDFNSQLGGLMSTTQVNEQRHRYTPLNGTLLLHTFIHNPTPPCTHRRVKHTQHNLCYITFFVHVVCYQRSCQPLPSLRICWTPQIIVRSLQYAHHLILLVPHNLALPCPAIGLAPQMPCLTWHAFILYFITQSKPHWPAPHLVHLLSTSAHIPPKSSLLHHSPGWSYSLKAAYKEFKRLFRVWVAVGRPHELAHPLRRGYKDIFIPV